MANVNVGQLRSVIHGLPAAQQVVIHAGVLKGILDAVKACSGNDPVIAQVVGNSPGAPIVLTGA